MMRNKKFIYEIQDCSILHQEYNTYALKNFNDWTIDELLWELNESTN